MISYRTFLTGSSLCLRISAHWEHIYIGWNMWVAMVDAEETLGSETSNQKLEQAVGHFIAIAHNCYKQQYRCVMQTLQRVSSTYDVWKFCPASCAISCIGRKHKLPMDGESEVMRVAVPLDTTCIRTASRGEQSIIGIWQNELLLGVSMSLGRTRPGQPSWLMWGLTHCSSKLRSNLVQHLDNEHVQYPIAARIIFISSFTNNGTGIVRCLLLCSLFVQCIQWFNANYVSLPWISYNHCPLCSRILPAHCQPFLPCLNTISTTFCMPFASASSPLSLCHQALSSNPRKIESSVCLLLMFVCFSNSLFLFIMICTCRLFRCEGMLHPILSSNIENDHI